MIKCEYERIKNGTEKSKNGAAAESSDIRKKLLDVNVRLVADVVLEFITIPLTQNKSKARPVLPPPHAHGHHPAAFGAHLRYTSILSLTLILTLTLTITLALAVTVSLMILVTTLNPYDAALVQAIAPLA